MEYQNIIVEQDGGVAWITLNRPEVLNAKSDALMAELKSALEGMEQDQTIKVAVLRGAGRAFCAGRDLNDLTARIQEEHPNENTSGVLYAEEFRHHAGIVRQIADILWRSPVVSIAQVHGYCVMGGWEMATICDLVVVADDARIVWRPVGGSGLAIHLWPWTIGLRKTKELLFASDFITGAQAAEIGMVNKSVPADSLAEEVRNLANKIAKRPREFLYLDKKATNKAFELMGLWNAWDYSVTAHVISHLVQPSKDLAQTFAEQSTKKVREKLSERVSPYTKGS